MVKFAESGLVFLLTIHLLGGLCILYLETIAWRPVRKSLRHIGAAAVLLAFIFLVRVF